MATQMEQSINELHGIQVQGVLYPMAHFGNIWRVQASDLILYPWELVKFEKDGNIPIANGWAHSSRDANEAMNAIIQLWVMYGGDYTTDKLTQPVPEPPSTPMGFQLSNR